MVKVMRAPSFSVGNIIRGVADVAHYRDLLYTLSVHRINVRYKQSRLGIAWAILQPLSLMLIYTVVFSYIARMPSGDTPYAVFSYTALLLWTYFSNALSNATNGLVNHSSLVTKVYFPREILPFTYVIAAVVDFLIASSILAVLLIYYRISLTLNALYALPVIFGLTVFVTAAALFFSAVQVRFRDVGVAMPLLLQLWMFASPVLYPLGQADKLPPLVRTLYMLNPMVGFVENFRRAVLLGVGPDWTTLGTAMLISLTLLPLAYIYFKRVEATVADII